MKNNNRFLIRLIFFINILFFASNCWAKQEIVILPKPNWVLSIAPAEAKNIPEDQIQNGIYYLLADSQIKVDQDDEPQYFKHYADYITNQAGVEKSSQINLSYDPAYQKLVLHSLQVIRDSTTLDRLNSARMKLIQREEDLDQLIYNGLLNLNIILDDVRVGDTIEYSYSIVGMNPVFNNIFAYSSNLSWSVPVAKQALRVLWNKPNPVHFEVVNSDLRLERIETKDGIEFRTQSENIQPIKLESYTPSWFEPWGKVYFSELESWEDVTTWGMKLYDDVIVTDESLTQLIAKIKSDNVKAEEQISAALRFVQDEIRYLGIEIGQNSHIPRAAPQTLKNRYGDCKDKTVLFQTLLKGLGIQSFPALVNTEENIEALIPSVHSFDHVITYFEFNGKSYWVDPTRSYQHGSIDDIHQPDYGYALVLRKGEKQLTKMQPVQSENGLDVIDTFSIVEEGPVVFTSLSKYFGWRAESQRRILESKGLDKLQQEFLQFFQSYYSDTAVSESIEIDDNTTKNELTISEHYQITDFWTDVPEKKRHEVTFYGYSATSSLVAPKETKRTQPLYQKHPNNIKQSIEVSFERDDWDFNEINFAEDNDFFKFHNRVAFDKEKRLLTLIYSYKSKVNHIPADRYEEYLAALKNVNNHKAYEIYNTYSSDKVTPETGSWYEPYMTMTNFLMIYAALYLLAIILWRLERRREKNQLDAIFFPISITKLIVMWFLTLGIYSMYWFYKNFRYIEDQENKGTMPKARGIFCYLWYYPLYSKLSEDSLVRFEHNKLPHKALAVLLAIAFLGFGYLAEKLTEYALIPILLSVLLILPLANYILLVNGSKSRAVAKISKWRFRHYLLVLLSTPLLVLGISSELGLGASNSVIKGDKLMQFDVKLMQRRGIINPIDEIEYFYSDALLFIRNDGNGFTSRHVFSYWKDEDGKVLQEQATYEQIQDIRFDRKTGESENSIVTIVRKDGSEFLLFVSNVDDKDTLFIEALKAHWLKSRPLE